MEPIVVKDRLRLLLDHFGEVRDPREAAKVRYPLREVLFLVTCATIAGCDDYAEIADWGEHHLGFLRGSSEYFFGVPKEDWLRVVVNRIDPALFEACFTAWALSLRADAADLIALDGKTLRRSGDSAAQTKPLHLVSAWASTQRLVLCQEAVDAKENECAAILTILERLSVKGALVTIDAIATNPTIAEAITQGGGDYVLALKRNQPSLHDEVERYFADPATTGL
jgi:DDE_Tnp_1-associated/Transposase DDE domain